MSDHPLVPPLGSRVVIEATVVALNCFPSDEGPTLPVPCVKVRDGISFGVACHTILGWRATPEPSAEPGNASKGDGT